MKNAKCKMQGERHDLGDWGSAVELGMYFGGISGAAITMRRNAVAQQLSRNKRFKGRVNRIKKRIMNI